VDSQRGPSLASSPIIERIAGVVLSERPDVERLASDVASALSLSEEAAAQLVRRVVSEVNARLFPPITHLELIHTEHCNLACTYCFEQGMRDSRRMPRPVTKKAIDLLIEYSRDADALWITHFGGEPLLNFENIRFATEYAMERATALGRTVAFDLTTNGTLLTQSTVDYLSQHGIRVLLSLDGLAPTHDACRVDRRGRGTFSRVIASLALLKTRQRWIGVKMTVMPANVSRLSEDVIGLHEHGVNQFVIGHATGVDWSPRAIETYREQLGHVYRWYARNKGPELRIAGFDEPRKSAGFFGCQAGRNSIAVSVTGEVSSCSKVLALDNRNLLARLGDVDLGMIHVKNRHDLVESEALRKGCQARGIASEYQGGCFASNYAAHRDLFTPSMQDHEFSVIERLVSRGEPRMAVGPEP
jgi:uncharacterized protein